MKQLLLTVIAAMACTIINAQSWQWAKRGGGSFNTNISGGRPEQAENIALDRNGNIYVMSVCNFTYNNVNVDGNSLTGRGVQDIVVSSFTCNGTYRWSKVIGTNGQDRAVSIKADTMDGVYIAGYINNYNRTAYFSTDTTIPSTAKQMFIVKYDTGGTYKWLRRPQPDTAGAWSATTGQSTIIAMDVDEGGNIYALCALYRGLFSNSYSVTTNGNQHILKYDRNGAFISGHQMDITAPALNPYLTEIYLKRNPANGNYLVSGQFQPGGATTYYGTTQLTSSIILSSFDTSGNLSWIKQNRNFDGTTFQEPSVDASGNIYFTGTAAGVDTFAGVPLNTGFTGISTPYAIIFKFDASGNVLWSKYSYSVFPNAGYGMATALLSNGELIVGGQWGGVFKWSAGGDSVTHPTNYGPDLFFTRFNAANGAYIKLDTVGSGPGNTKLESPTCMIADKRNNFYMGGMFSENINFPSGTITAVSGGDNDFFVAKYGYNNCNCTIPTSSYTYTTSVSTSQFTFTGNASGADSVVWSFGDGTKQTVTSGFTTPVSHTYSTTGYFIVCSIVYSNCGGPIYSCGQDTISCVPVLSGLTYTNTGGTTVQLTYTGTATGLDSLIWQFGDGQKQTLYSSYATPITHTYAATGVYNICATASSYKCGSAIDCKKDSLTCTAPAAGYAMTTSAMTVQLTYNGGTNYLDSLVWDFGDGQTLKVTSGYTTPVSHTFITGGAFNICAKSYSICGNTQYCAKDTITATGVGGINALAGVKIYPNPANSYFVIEGAAAATAILTNGVGQEVMRFSVNADKQVMDVASLPVGVYTLQLTDAKGNRGATTLVKQ